MFDSEPLSNVALVLDTAQRHVGMATLVNQRTMLTCAHVVRSILGSQYDPNAGSTATLNVRWPTHPDVVQAAQVLVEGWVAVDEFGRGDLAVLRLTEDPPKDVHPAVLIEASAFEEHTFRAYGAGPDGTPVRSDGSIRGREGPGGTWVRLESRPGVGARVSRGFSGSAVFDVNEGGVVGLVVARDADDEARSSFFLPCAYLATLWRPLEAHILSEFERSLEAKEHWLPRARGVGSSSEQGWFFSGRRAAIDELTARARGLDVLSTQYFCVTGSPGAGKSAILARLPVLADRRLASLAARGIDEIRLTSIDVIAVHLRQMSFADVISALAHRLGTAASGTDGLIDAIHGRRRLRSRHLILVFDALDEAADTQARSRLARDLIRRLGNEATRLDITVVVSSRSGVEGSENEELIRLLGRKCQRLQIDSPQYVSPSDFVNFVEGRLSSDAAENNPYRDDDDKIELVAKRVAQAAYPVYLVAQLVTRSLLDDPELTEQELEERHFPHTVGEAFENYIARFGPDEQRLRDLLSGLSHARGVGFERGAIWLETTLCISGRRYSLQDLDWLLGSGAAFLIETVTESRAPRYRLYHQALVDLLQDPAQGTAVYELLRDRLLTSLDDSEGETYLRAHLSGHAVAAARLSEFLLDPVAVANCDVTTVLRDAARAGQGISEEADRARLALSSVAFQLATCPHSERRAYLSLAGHQYGVTSYWARSDESWWDVWYADWDVASEHVLVERGRPFTAVTVVRASEDAVIVSADADGLVTFRWMEDRSDAFQGFSVSGVITCLAAAAIDHDIVVCVGTDTGELHTWDSRRRRTVRIVRSGAPITSVSLRARDRRAFEVLSTSSGGEVELQIRSLSKRKRRVTSNVDAPATASCFLSQRDTFLAIGTAGSGILLVRHEDLAQDRGLGAPDAEYVRMLHPKKYAADEELSVVAATSTAFGVWGLEYGFLRQELFGDWAGRGASVFYEHGNGIAAVSNGADIQVRAPLDGGTRTFRGHEEAVRGLSVIEVGSDTELVSVSDDGSMRIWPLRESDAVTTLTSATNRYQAVLLNPYGRSGLATNHQSRLVIFEDNQPCQELDEPRLPLRVEFVSERAIKARDSENRSWKLLMTGGTWEVSSVGETAQYQQPESRPPATSEGSATWTQSSPIVWDEVGNAEVEGLTQRSQDLRVDLGSLLGAAGLEEIQDAFLVEPFRAHAPRVLLWGGDRLSVVEGEPGREGRLHWALAHEIRDFVITEPQGMLASIVSDDESSIAIVCDSSSMRVLDASTLEERGRVETGGGAPILLHVVPRRDHEALFSFAVGRAAGLIVGEFVVPPAGRIGQVS